MDSLGGILTNGLGGDCTAMILGPFRLKVFIDVNDIVPIIASGGGGGTFPIDTTYEVEDLVPEELKKLVTIAVVMGKHRLEREYIVSKDRSDRIVEVTNFINKTMAAMSVGISNFRHKVKRVTAQFTKKNTD